MPTSMPESLRTLRGFYREARPDTFITLSNSTEPRCNSSGFMRSSAALTLHVRILQGFSSQTLHVRVP